MTKEEFEELKETYQAVVAGERAPDDLYQLLDVCVGDLIDVYESSQKTIKKLDYENRKLFSAWEKAEQKYIKAVLAKKTKVRDDS